MNKNRNSNKLLYLNYWIQGKTNTMMWNNIIAMIVEQFTCLPPYNQSSLSPAAQPSFTLGWQIATFHKWREITFKGKLLLCFAIFFSEMIILGIMSVRTRNSEWLMWENDTLSNYISNIIIHCSFGTTSQQYLQETTHVGMKDRGYTILQTPFLFSHFFL